MRINFVPGLLPEATEIQHEIEVLNNLVADIHSAIYAIRHASPDQVEEMFARYFPLVFQIAERHFREIYLNHLRKPPGTETSPDPTNKESRRKAL